MQSATVHPAGAFVCFIENLDNVRGAMVDDVSWIVHDMMPVHV